MWKALFQFNLCSNAFDSESKVGDEEEEEEKNPKRKEISTTYEEKRKEVLQNIKQTHIFMCEYVWETPTEPA